jgi:deoxycytidine triphosphate deaminase
MTRTKEIKINGYEGSVTIKPMRNIDKFDLMETLGLNTASLTKLSKKKNVAPGDVDFSLSTIKKMFEKAKELVVAVDLKKDGVEFKSWDDLDYDSNALALQMEIVNYAIGMGK